MKKHVFVILLLLCVCGIAVLTACRTHGENGVPTNAASETEAETVLDPADYPPNGTELVKSTGNVFDTGTYLISDGDFYHGAPVSGMVKLSYDTHTLTPVCVDPLCAHDESCPLYGTSSIYFVWGDEIVYQRSFGEPYEVIDDVTVNQIIYAYCTYNMKTGAYRELGREVVLPTRTGPGKFDFQNVTENHQILRGLFRDGDRAYTVLYLPKTEDPSCEADYEPTVVYYDLKTGRRTSVMPIGGRLNPETIAFLFADRGALYVADAANIRRLDTETGELTALLPEGTFFMRVSALCGDWIYFNLFDRERDALYAARVNVQTHELQQLTDVSGSACLVSNRYVYVITEPEGGHKAETFVLRMEHDGSDPTVVGSFAESMGVFFMAGGMLWEGYTIGGTFALDPDTGTLYRMPAYTVREDRDWTLNGQE